MSQKDSPLMICHNFLISHVFPNLYGILSNVKHKMKYFGEWWQLNRMDKNAMEINETQNCLVTNILQITLTDHFIR